jgi:hypothetical protein
MIQNVGMSNSILYLICFNIHPDKKHRDVQLHIVSSVIHPDRKSRDVQLHFIFNLVRYPSRQKESGCPTPYYI